METPWATPKAIYIIFYIPICYCSTKIRIKTFVTNCLKSFTNAFFSDLKTIVAVYYMSIKDGMSIRNVILHSCYKMHISLTLDNYLIVQNLENTLLTLILELGLSRLFWPNKSSLRNFKLKNILLLDNKS